MVQVLLLRGVRQRCVEIAISDEDGDVAIRNSTCPQLTIRTSRAAFAALVTHLRTTSPG